MSTITVQPYTIRTFATTVQKPLIDFGQALEDHLPSLVFLREMIDQLRYDQCFTDSFKNAGEYLEQLQETSKHRTLKAIKLREQTISRMHMRPIINEVLLCEVIDQIETLHTDRIKGNSHFYNTIAKFNNELTGILLLFQEDPERLAELRLTSAELKTLDMLFRVLSGSPEFDVSELDLTPEGQYAYNLASDYSEDMAKIADYFKTLLKN